MYPVSNAIINMVIKMKSYKDIVWLFSINVFISTFTFGGGYVVIPMIRSYRLSCMEWRLVWQR